MNPKVASSLCLFVVGALAFSGCGLLKTYTKKPKVGLKKVDVIGVDFQQARLRAELSVTNQIPATLSLARVNWKVETAGQQVVSGAIDKVVSIAANQTVPVHVPFALKFEDLYRISQNYKDKDDAPYTLTGDLELDTPIGPLKIPFSHNGRVPVLKIPAVDLAKVEVRGVSFTGADVRLGFHVKNPNKIALDVQALEYALTLAGARIAEGNLPNALSIPAHGTGSFAADVKVSFTQAQAAVQKLKSASDADYSIGGKFTAKTPWGPVSAPYSKSGTVRIQN